jgi:hypothetical protein
MTRAVAVCRAEPSCEWAWGPESTWIRGTPGGLVRDPQARPCSDLGTLHAYSVQLGRHHPHWTHILQSNAESCGPSGLSSEKGS